MTNLRKPNKIVRIAAAVRRATEVLANRHMGRRPDYKTDLAGYCGVASLALARLLEEADVEASVQAGFYGEDELEGHAWVRLSNGVVLDVTITQFGKYPKVYMGPGTRLTAKQSYPVEKWVPAHWVVEVVSKAKTLLEQL